MKTIAGNTKQKTRNRTLLVLISSTIIFFSSCNHHHEDFAGIPELKKRNVMLIEPAEEWDAVQTRFANLQRDVKKNPKDVAAKLSLADIYLNEARVTGDEHYYTAAALYILNDALDADLKDAEKNQKNDELKFRALTMKSFAFASEHQFAQALETGKEAVALNPYNSLIYGVLVDANVELGNYTEAVAMCEKMMDIRPDLRSYSRTSYLREIHGDIDGAIEAMKLAVSAGAPGQEQTAWCRITLGKLYENHGDLVNAEVQYGLALQERPNYPHALAGIGRVEMKKKNFIASEKLLNRAIAIMPSAAMYEDLAMLYAQTGDRKKQQNATATALEKMEHHHDHDSNVGLERAYLHLRLKEDYNAALRCMKDEINMRPENIEVNKVMAWAYYGKGDFKKADEHILKAMKTNSQDAEMLCVAGMIKIKSGQEEDGKALLKKALDVNPYAGNNYLAKEAGDLLAKL